MRQDDRGRQAEPAAHARAREPRVADASSAGTAATRRSTISSPRTSRASSATSCAPASSACSTLPRLRGALRARRRDPHAGRRRGDGARGLRADALRRRLAVGPRRAHAEEASTDPTSPPATSLFTGKAQCATCHPPPLYTDLGYHRLGAQRLHRRRPRQGRPRQGRRVQDADAARRRAPRALLPRRQRGDARRRDRLAPRRGIGQGADPTSSIRHLTARGARRAVAFVRSSPR